MVKLEFYATSFPRSIIVTSSRGNRACRTRMLYEDRREDVCNKSCMSVMMSRGCYEGNGPVKFELKQAISDVTS